MFNQYKTTIVKIKDIKEQTLEIKLFTLVFEDKKEQKKFNPLPGQIIEVGILGFGEGPFAPCSCGLQKDFFQICVRNVGRLTKKIHSLKIGDKLMIRGPYGLGTFPENDRNLLLIAGGLGLAPLRSLILKYANLREKESELTRNTHPNPSQEGINNVQLFYGVRSQKDLIFRDEYDDWKKYIDMRVTLDKQEKGWKGHIGLITTLFQDVKIIENPIAILCGPPVMFRFVLVELKKIGVKDDDIYMSLERRMHCGVGVCQHCAIGSKYVCKDGPVFRWSDVMDINGII